MRSKDCFALVTLFKKPDPSKEWGENNRHMSTANSQPMKHLEALEPNQNCHLAHYVCIFNFQLNSQLILNVNFKLLCVKPTLFFRFIKSYRGILYFLLLHSVLKALNKIPILTVHSRALVRHIVWPHAHAQFLSLSVPESWDRIDGNTKNSPLMILTSTSQPAWLTLAQAPLRLPLCALSLSTLTSKSFVSWDGDS